MNSTRRMIMPLALGLLLPLCACTGEATQDTASAPHDAAPGAAPASPAPAEDLKPEAGYLVGQVFDTRGQPLPGATVLLSHGVFHARHLHATTDANGRYRIQFDIGGWNALAHIKKEYNGRRYSLELEPDSIDSIGMDGAVRNFTWTLQGRTQLNDDYYYGGTIAVHADGDLWRRLDDIVLTLTPDGPLIDGSNGETLRIRRGDRYWPGPDYIEDVPIGRYQVTAMLEDENGPRPLRVQDWTVEGNVVPRLQLDFLPQNAQGSSNYAAIALYE